MNFLKTNLKFPENAKVSKNFEIKIPKLLGWDIANTIAKFNEITLNEFLNIFNVKIYNRSIVIN